MPYTVTYDEAGFVHAVYEGDLTLPGIRAFMISVGDSLKEHDCFLVLSDYRKAVMAVSILDLYELPGMVLEGARERGLSAHKIRRALIIPARVYDTFHFFETVSRNKMQIVKIFTDENRAREWLLGKDA